MRPAACVLFATLMPTLSAVSSLAHQDAPPAVPVEPITAILDAFRSHRLVALHDGHGNEQAHAFLLSLLRDPRLPATVNDIVVSIGNARYQDVVDRFVRAEQVPADSLRLAWRNTTAPNTSGELPMHEELFGTVRAVNGSLPRERQLRVLLADPPIDWDSVRSPADYRKWYEMRVGYAAAIVQLEVLAKERRALLVLGLPELQRKNVFSNYEMQDWRVQTIVGAIESTSPARVFTVWGAPQAGLAALQADVVSWRVPSLATIRGTALGALDFTAFFWSPPRGEIRDAGRPGPGHGVRQARSHSQREVARTARGRPVRRGALPRAAVRHDPGSIVSIRLHRARLPGDEAEAHRRLGNPPARG